jgi:hypothetical protein
MILQTRIFSSGESDNSPKTLFFLRRKQRFSVTANAQATTLQKRYLPLGYFSLGKPK